VGQVEGALGEAVKIGSRSALYGLVSGRLEAGDQVNSVLSTSAAAGVVLRGSHMAFAAEGGLRQGIDRDEFTRPFGRAELRLGRGHSRDLRLHVEEDDATEWGLSAAFYW
jgi:hypothetical protein